MNITPFLSKHFFFRFLTNLCLFLVCINCSNNNNYDRNCNFLLNVGIQVSLNLNLAQYNPLASQTILFMCPMKVMVGCLLTIQESAMWLLMPQIPMNHLVHVPFLWSMALKPTAAAMKRVDTVYSLANPCKTQNFAAALSPIL